MLLHKHLRLIFLYKLLVYPENTFSLFFKVICAYSQMNVNPKISSSLTAKEQRVLDLILAYQQEEGRPPSTREVAQRLGLKSQGSVMQYWRSLERKGFIERQPGKARSVVFKRAARREDGRTILRDVREVSIEGDIAAGMPADAPPQQGDTLLIDARPMKLTATSRPFALRVCGESMTGAGIHNGDYVVLDRAREARDKEVVAALVDGESTLKRLDIRDGQVFLVAANLDYPEIGPVRDLVVQGVMVGLVRGAPDEPARN